jgi:hypothetical protein
LQNIEADEDGYFRIASGHLEAGSSELVPITIHWWWNTSYYIGTPNSDESANGNYYAVALEDYLDLVDIYDARVSTANAFWADHQQVVTTVDEVEIVVTTVLRSCPYGDSDAAHEAAYQDCEML